MGIRISTNGKRVKKRKNDKNHPRQTLKVTYPLQESESVPMAGSQKEREQ